MIKNLILLSAVLASSVVALPSNAFNTRRAAEQECNSRIRSGLVAANQLAFNSCVQQQEQVLGAYTNTPGARGYCAGVEEEIQSDPDFANDPALAAQVRLMTGC